MAREFVLKQRNSGSSLLGGSVLVRFLGPRIVLGSSGALLFRGDFRDDAHGTQRTAIRGNYGASSGFHFPSTMPSLVVHDRMANYQP